MSTQPEPAWHGANFLDESQREVFLNDPHSLFRRLREEAPVNLTPIGVWRVSRYEDVLRMLREPGAGVRRADGGCASWSARRSLLARSSSSGSGPRRSPTRRSRALSIEERWTSSKSSPSQSPPP